MPSTEIDALREYCSSNGRVCPQPDRWKELWERLPDRERVAGQWQPSLPLILSGWWYSSDEAKTKRLLEHVDWAESHGCLTDIAQFLRALPESDWHHHGD